MKNRKYIQLPPGLKRSVSRWSARNRPFGLSRRDHCVTILAATVVAAFLVLSASQIQAQDDAVFRAMNDEMARSVAKLSIEDVPPPYFLAYRVRDYDVLTVKARYNGLVQSDRSRDRYLYMDLRVGDDSLDNSNFFADWQNVYNSRQGLVTENQYEALRHQLWYSTDKAYKEAAENLAGKKAWLLAHPTKDQIPDQSAAEPFVYLGKPSALEADQAAVEALVRQAAGVLADYNKVVDWRVEFSGQAVNQWYLNSQGGKHLKGNVYYILEISATTQASDGQRLTNFLHYPVTKFSEMPSAKDLTADVRRMAGDLQAMASAPALDEYIGPVLFSDWAAAQFVSQMIVENFDLPREPLMANEWMKQFIPSGKLTGKVKHRVLPDFVTITDEPSRQSWQGKSLTGYQIVDDEGVKCQDIPIVEKGRLVNLPMTRQPTKKIPVSNGHARSTAYQLVLPGISNLLVSSTQPKDKLVDELRRLCKEQDVEFGLLVTRLDEPRFDRDYQWTEREDDGKTMLTAPVVAYKVYAKDSRTEAVRGLTFDELSVMTLRTVAALGKDVKAYNMTQPTMYEESMYPASIITPSILVEEMELKAATAYEPMPVAENPMFGK